jgi:hypothetical protein
MIDPFSAGQLDLLFSTSVGNPDLLRKRESTTLELKANYQSGSRERYAKTMAAFANRGGGYLLFGVANKPHRLVGMTNNRFEELDPATLSQFLDGRFSPSIDWEHHVHSIDGRDFGVIHVREARTKPVVCTLNGQDIRDGEIYYRYAGRTKVIGSAEVQALIEDRVRAEREDWRNLLFRSAHITPSATYLLDIEDGKASGTKRSFVISPALLEQVKFIHEGRFEEAGEPALKVIGDVEVVRTETLPAVVEDVPVDPSQYCSLYEAAVVTQLKERIGNTVLIAGAPKPLNGFHLRAAVRAHAIKSPSKMYFRPAIKGGRPQYRPELIEWVTGEFQKDLQFFDKAVQSSQSAAN